MKTRIALFFLLSGLALAPLQGQTKPAAKPVAPKPAPAPAADPVQQGLTNAMNQLDKGDVAGAQKTLEELARRPAPPPQVLAFLGAVYLKANRPKDALAVLQPLAEAPGADPAVLYNTARAAFAVGRGDFGLKYLRASVAKQPSSPAARDLGLLLARQGSPVEAYQVLLPWAIDTPDDVDARLAATLLALHFERLGDAEKLLAGLPQTNARVRLLRGDLLVKKGDAKAAVAILKPLVDSPPPGMDTSPAMAGDARRMLADAYLHNGQAAAAVKLLDGKVGNDSSAALVLALAQQKSGNLKAALATLAPWADKLLKSQNPRDPFFVSEFALTYGRMLAADGRRPEAAAAFQVATRVDPESPEPWQAYAQTLTAMSKKDEADKALAQYREVTKEREQARAASAAAAKGGTGAPAGGAAAPATSGPAANPALALVQKGELDKALTTLRQQIQAAPKDLAPRMLEWRVLLMMKRNPEALQSAEQALQAAPENPDVLYARGVSHMVLSQPKEAEADLRHALKVAPRHLAAMNDLAVLLMDRGDPAGAAEAQTLLESVLRARPDDKVAAENLAKLQKKG
ncbi:MAG TPA: tetratricopeptide repeat protein [Thermoanaerobaculia bacterium]|nr:tetratricopeptide repeat protein [Thermoanaerobaculia bacterium]